ncbi:MAG TPA: hypothetical protein VNX68_12070 [Nitrosopumilaceae archaeon]|jgi:hypothetical protein|nr:hypothetical protein [Nitrosopumilaceae archaeon]
MQCYQPPIDMVNEAALFQNAYDAARQHDLPFLILLQPCHLIYAAQDRLRLEPNYVPTLTEISRRQWRLKAVAVLLQVNGNIFILSVNR